MEVRFTYRAEIYVKGDTLEEIKEKWPALNLDPISKDDECVTDFAYVELVSAENVENYDDLMSNFK